MSQRRRDGLGTALGLLTFLGGLALVVATFVLARSFFSMPPEQALGIKPGETMDINRVLVAGMMVLIKVVLLIVMAGIGSIIASRGIKLYVLSGQTYEPAKEEAGRDDRI